MTRDDTLKRAAALLRHMSGAGSTDEYRSCNDCATALDALRDELARPMQHPDDEAVDRFAAAMKAKLAKARDAGRSGWQDPAWPVESIGDNLREHVEKGDPRDVANYCMFLFERGERIPQPAQYPLGTGRAGCGPETMMKTYYSTDDENYCHETPGDVFDALYSEGRLVAGAIYWEADFLLMEPQQALNAAQVLEEADERGYELIGEVWDNPFSVPRDAQMELQNLLDAWAAKHVDVSRYYTMSGKPRQLKVTDADLPG